MSDRPGLDVVLGLDFLEKYDPALKWKKREMHLVDPRPGIDATYIIPAETRESLPYIDTKLRQLRTMQELAHMCVSNELSDGDGIWLGFVRCENKNGTPDPSVYGPLSGKGATHPGVQSILEQFHDVLRIELPSGAPPQRLGVDGKPIEHTIELDSTSKPYAAQPRKLSVDEDAELLTVLKELLAKGWAYPSLSPHAAPIVFVRKKPDPVSGKRALRMCVSYVKLNRNTLNKIAYRLPRIATLIDQVCSARYFSKLDLVSGYWQVPMRASDVPKTAFTTPYGNFEFHVMPFGLCGAPSTFQHMMDSVFAHPTVLSDETTLSFAEFVATYLDDICFSVTPNKIISITSVMCCSVCESISCMPNLANANGCKLASNF